MSDEGKSEGKRWSLEKKRNILIVILVLTYCAIWGQSCMSLESSQAESNAVMSALEPIHGVDVATANNTGDAWGYWNKVIRKTAHVLEYMVLGIELALLTYFGIKRKGVVNKKNYVQLQFNILMIGLSTAVVDETIQLFSNRGSLVEDIWIDMLGIVLGIAAFIIFSVRKVHFRE